MQKVPPDVYLGHIFEISEKNFRTKLIVNTFFKDYFSLSVDVIDFFLTA